MIQSIDNELINANKIGITGHIRPDGDCAGSTLGLYNYIKDNYKEKEVSVFLEPIEAHFSYMRGYDNIISSETGDESFDLFIILDCGDMERIASFARKYVKNAKHTICIDHHVTNFEIADINHVLPKISSASEVLYELLDENKISKYTAECLYTGMVHDTGVFKYQSTTKRTMEIAGVLMDKGIDFTSIIDDTFFRKSYVQNILLGHALVNSRMLLNDKIIYSYMPFSMLEEYKVPGRDLGGIIDQLRFTEGVEVAVFIYDLPDGSKKVSLRSVRNVDVNLIANTFGGGGHIRAAGCTVNMEIDDIMAKIQELVDKQL